MSSSQLEVLEHATRAFLGAMRREHVKRHGIDAPVNVPEFDDMALSDRQMMMRAIKAAIDAAEQARDPLFGS